MDDIERENIFDFKLEEGFGFDSGDFEEDYEEEGVEYMDRHWKSQRFRECGNIAS